MLWDNDFRNFWTLFTAPTHLACDATDKLKELPFISSLPDSKSGRWTNISLKWGAQNGNTIKLVAKCWRTFTANTLLYIGIMPKNEVTFSLTKTKIYFHCLAENCSEHLVWRLIYALQPQPNYEFKIRVTHAFAEIHMQLHKFWWLKITVIL